MSDAPTANVEDVQPDDQTVTAILAALLACPVDRRMDSMAVANDVFLRAICPPLSVTR